jgi:hypothetical protein
VVNPDKLRLDPKALALVRGYVAAGKPVASICHGPWLLVAADVLRGRRATAWYSIRTDLKNVGATIVDEEVVLDGNIITSRMPSDLPAFNRAIVAALRTERKGTTSRRVLQKEITMSSKFQLLINCKSREGSEGVAVDVISPATGESIGKVAYGAPADIAEAIETARSGLQSWQAVPAWERGRILKDAAGIIRRDADRIAEMLTLEQGKLLAQARDEVYRAAGFIEWCGGQARRIAGRTVPGRQAGQHIEV